MSLCFFGFCVSASGREPADSSETLSFFVFFCTLQHFFWFLFVFFVPYSTFFVFAFGILNVLVFFWFFAVRTTVLCECH